MPGNPHSLIYSSPLKPKVLWKCYKRFSSDANVNSRFRLLPGRSHLRQIFRSLIRSLPLLSPEKCDTVCDFTSLTINGLLQFDVRLFLLMANSRENEIVSAIFVNELMKCMHTCCRQAAVIKPKRLNETKNLCSMHNSRNPQLICECHSRKKRHSVRMLKRFFVALEECTQRRQSLSRASASEQL